MHTIVHCKAHTAACMAWHGSMHGVVGQHAFESAAGSVSSGVRARTSTQAGAQVHCACLELHRDVEGNVSVARACTGVWLAGVCRPAAAAGSGAPRRALDTAGGSGGFSDARVRHRRPRRHRNRLRTRQLPRRPATLRCRLGRDKVQNRALRRPPVSRRDLRRFRIMRMRGMKVHLRLTMTMKRPRFTLWGRPTWTMM